MAFTFKDFLIDVLLVVTICVVGMVGYGLFRVLDETRSAVLDARGVIVRVNTTLDNNTKKIDTIMDNAVAATSDLKELVASAKDGGVKGIAVAINEATDEVERKKQT